MATRVSATDQTRERLEALIDGRLASAPERSDLMLLAARLILEEALEGEVRDRLGRERTVVHGSAGRMHCPSPVFVHAMRTDSGRPSSSIRFRARTAMATEVA